MTEAVGLETAGAPKHPDALRGIWAVLIAAVVLQVGFSLAETGLTVLTGFIKSDLGLSAAGAASLFSFYMGGKVVASYATGAATDRIGEAPVLVWSTLLAALGFVAVAGSNYPLIFVTLFICGALGAGTMSAGASLIRHLFPPARRGFAIGLRQTGVPVGGVLAAAVLPLVAHAFGWRWAMVVAAALCALGAFPLGRIAGRHRIRGRRRGDRAGAVTRAIKLLTVWGTIAVIAQFALFIFLPLDLHQRAHFSLTAAAAFSGIVQLFGVGGRLGWGWAGDRFIRHGRELTLGVAALLSAAACGVLAVIPGSAGPGIWAAAAAFAGLTIVGYQGLYIAMLAEATHAEGVGTAIGFTMTFTTLGGVVGPLALGVLADATGGYQWVWGVLALALLVAFVPLRAARAAAR